MDIYGILNFCSCSVRFFYLLHRISTLEERIGRQPGRRYERVPEESVPPAVPALETQVLREVAMSTEKSPAKSDQDIEFQFGGQIFTWVGAVALMFGIGFFLKYAFDNNWITPAARIILGMVAGLGLVGFGEFARRKYPEYGYVVSGAGIGILYLSVYASFGFYQLVSQPTAFLEMIAVTALCIVLAIRYDALPLAFFAQIGGFLTPFLLSTGTNNPHALFGYIALLDIVVFAVGLRKVWRPVIFGTIVGTALVYLSWSMEFYTRDQLWIAEGYATLFFVILFGASLAQYLILKNVRDERDLVSLGAVSGLYFLASYIIINPVYPDWMGLFTALLALLHFAVVFLIPSNDEAGWRYRVMLAGIGFMLSVIAVPIQFDKHWITIGWAAEALVFSVLGFSLQSFKLRVLANIVFLGSFIRLMFFESILVPDAAAWTNTRFLSYMAVFLFSAAAAYVFASKRSELDQRESAAPSFLLVAGFCVFVAAVSLEIWDFYNHRLLSIFLPLAGVTTVLVSLVVKDFALRFAGYSAIAFAIARLFIAESSVNVLTYTPILNQRVFLFLISIVTMFFILAALYSAREKISKNEFQFISTLLAFGVNALLLFLLSVELLDYYNQQYKALDTNERFRLRDHYDNIKNVSLSVAWTLYAIALMVIGIIARSSPARILAIGLFGIVIFKVFLYDTSRLDNFYRFIAFITLGVILLLTGYLYHRYKDRIAQFIQVAV